MQAPEIDMRAYFSGKRLYGEDLNDTELAEWYASEEQGFADLGAKDRERYEYGYHALNRFHGYRFLGRRRFAQALAFGSAYGDELSPIASRIGAITLLDASASFAVDSLHGRPVRYLKASRDGLIDLADGSVDLITCFGVLHHVPHVRRTIAEFARILMPGGFALIREPITSMGDWRLPRRGLTKHERGIPSPLLSDMIVSKGLHVRRVAHCVFPVVERMGRMFGRFTWNSSLAVRLDAAVSQLFCWNNAYHRQTFRQKLAPAHAFWIACKPQA